jgi:hypothetical protein
MQGTPIITTIHGFCHGCREGRVGEQHYGFALCVVDGQPPRWYCQYCGSSEVTIIIEDGPSSEMPTVTAGPLGAGYYALFAEPDPGKRTVLRGRRGRYVTRR